jgi:hypothetical protein
MNGITRTAAVVLAAVAILWTGAARAEEKHGIQVYPGARADPGLSAQLAKAFGKDVACYRTGDAVGKVTEFYKKQPGLTVMGTTPEGGAFTKGDLMVTVQNPWKDLKTGAMQKDTLISIVPP